MIRRINIPQKGISSCSAEGLWEVDEGVASWDVDEADIVVIDRYLVVNVEDVMLIRNSDMLNGSKVESETSIPTELVNCTTADMMIVLSCTECTQLHCAESTQ